MVLSRMRFLSNLSWDLGSLECEAVGNIGNGRKPRYSIAVGQ